MNEQEDERMQQWLESDLSASPDEIGSLADAKTYKRLFDALKTEPEAGLPYNFSVKIERQILLQKQRSRQALLYALLSLVAIILLVGGVLMGQNQADASGLLSFPSNYQWPLIFGTSVLVLRASTIKKTMATEHIEPIRKRLLTLLVTTSTITSLLNHKTPQLLISPSLSRERFRRIINT